ncbi:MAG: LLM class flavin-dependent oxidoreductase [Pleurocapsa minor GSE-CHR-MK-17-07R]|jgi:alkanesulfonate monooxygenase SsuD/methylene tetrahydromethanopterin reductase-like flavin-dependent oxidoreductase (luciferase family)|nr:LLM class flavin-dependent oxidoreductase [Pleurocapsa minor GSE-CHR-MK 17-07R]
MTRALGVMFRCVYPPESLIPFAKQAEILGFDELWIVEDCFWAGGLTSTTLALASTRDIPVGLGIMPAVVRNPAITAMEISALGRFFPGRFHAGIGHGVADWMRRIGAFPPSQLAALEETITSVRALMAGERLNTQGKHVALEDVKLVFPPHQVPPVSAGVRGDKSLRLAGRSADGTILAEIVAPAYVRHARAQIAVGQAEAGRTEHHRLTVYTFCSVGDDLERAVDRLRPIVGEYIASGAVDAQLAPTGLLEPVKALLAEVGPAAFPNAMPVEWFQQTCIVGTAEACHAALDALYEAGADSVVLVPPPDATPEDLGELTPVIR